MSTMAMPQATASEAAVRYLITNYSPKGNKVGWLMMASMVLFIVLALAQAFVPNVAWLVVIRFLLGIPLGSDISTGYTYIMESMAKGQREVMGNRWQFMFAVGEVATLAVIALFLVADLDHE